MKTHLRIKIKTLAEESRIIRRETHRWLRNARRGRASVEAKKKMLEGGEGVSGYCPTAENPPLRAWMWNSLYRHRVDIVRPSARHALLALAFLRGKPYSSAEQFYYSPPDWKAVWKNVARFSGGFTEQLSSRFENWKAEGEELQRERRRRNSTPSFSETEREEVA